VTRRSFAVVIGITLSALLQCDAISPKHRSAAPDTSARAPSATRTDRAEQALEDLDRRTAVPLLPMMANHQRENMRDHLVAVQEIISATSTGDFAAVERTSKRIGYSEQMGRMCSHMGLGAPGFTERAIAFHRTADTITAAARQRDHAGVLTALGATLATCTGCHAEFRQQVVDEATWSKLAESTAERPSH
jgi:hypothetical protein